MKIVEREAKSIIVPSRLPDADYVVNPYTGCQFACLYCYATFTPEVRGFTSRFVNEPRSGWGSYVYVKKNAVELATRQLEKWPPSKKEAVIMFSSVTDPYQGLERRYQLTRGVLQALVDARHPGLVTILTKSPLVLRDVDLPERLNAEAGLTITPSTSGVTTADDQLSRLLEVTASLASRRLDTFPTERGFPCNSLPPTVFAPMPSSAHCCRTSVTSRSYWTSCWARSPLLAWTRCTSSTST
jgi:DNA repair photolyase